MAGLSLLVQLYTGEGVEIDDGGGVACIRRSGGATAGPGGAVGDRALPGGDGVDAERLTRLVRDAVPAHLSVRCEATMIGRQLG